MSKLYGKVQQKQQDGNENDCSNPRDSSFSGRDRFRVMFVMVAHLDGLQNFSPQTRVRVSFILRYVISHFIVSAHFPVPDR